MNVVKEANKSSLDTSDSEALQFSHRLVYELRCDLQSPDHNVRAYAKKLLKKAEAAQPQAAAATTQSSHSPESNLQESIDNV